MQLSISKATTTKLTRLLKLSWTIFKKITYCYKEAVLDEMAVENETQLVTRISIPV